MNDIRFVPQDGGFDKLAPGTDHVSMLIFYGVVQERSQEIDITSVTQLYNLDFDYNPLIDYHVREFFRIAPGARLIVKVLTTPSYQYEEIAQMQRAKQGVIKQVGVWNGKKEFSNSDAIMLHNVCLGLVSENMPLFALVSPRVSNYNFAVLPDLYLPLRYVGVVIGNDPQGYGTQSNMILHENQVGIIGATMGAIARSQVHTSLQWVEKQNVVTNTYFDSSTGAPHNTRELDNLGFLGGIRYNDLTPAQIDAIDAKGYIFLRKHVGIAGSYFNHSRVSADKTSDYTHIEHTRTMNKACRVVYADLLPKLGSPAYIDAATGFLTVDTVTALEAIAENGLAQMQRDGELSAYSVYIDPNQPLLTTGMLQVTVRIVPVGVLRNIQVNIGFTLKINN